MTVAFREENGIVVLGLEGKIMGTPQDDSLLDKVYKYIEDGKIRFVLDFSRIDWINSRGLRICITIYTALNNRGGGLKLACLSKRVDSFLDNCKMLAVFETYKTVEEAVKSFR